MARAGVESDAPVAEDGEEEDADKEVRQRNERVREDVRARAVQPVHALPHEHLPLLEERGDPRDGHKPEERDGEEVREEHGRGRDNSIRKVHIICNGKIELRHTRKEETRDR